MRTKKITALLLTGAIMMGMAVGGCSKINESATFATLDGTAITMGVANFCAKYQQAGYEVSMMSYFGEDMWNSDLYGNGQTLSQDVKENIAEQLQTMYLLKAHMADYDIALSDEDEAAIAKAADDFIAANSKAALRQIGAENKENVMEMLRLYTIQNRMHSRIIEDADTNVTDEEAAQRTFSYLQIDTTGYTDEDSNHVDYTDEEKEDLIDTASTLAKTPADEFEAAVTDAGYTLSTASYGSAEDEDATMDKAVLEAADELKEGEISDVVETDSACYVVRLDSEHDEEATASKKEQLISQKQEDHYNDILDGWKEKAEWKINEKEWEKVKFEDHFTQPAADTETDTESLTGTEEALDGEGVSDTESMAGTETD